MTQLFSKTELKSKLPRARRDRRRRRVPTGAPRLVESPTERTGRLDAEAWGRLVEAIRVSSEARLDLLRGREDGERIGCPWSAIAPCDFGCRCRGLGMVTVYFLRDHYAHLATEIQLLVAPTRRPS